MIVEFNDSDGSAFADNKQGETARILMDIANKVLEGKTEGKISDINGNTVGKWGIGNDGE